MHPVENAEADRLRALRDDGKDDRHGRRRRSRGIYTEKMGLTQKESGNVPNAGKDASRPEEIKLTDLK